MSNETFGLPVGVLLLAPMPTAKLPLVVEVTLNLPSPETVGFVFVSPEVGANPKVKGPLALRVFPLSMLMKLVELVFAATEIAPTDGLLLTFSVPPVVPPAAAPSVSAFVEAPKVPPVPTVRVPFVIAVVPTYV